MLGHLQYKILRALKEGAVSELGVFFDVCKYVIDDNGEGFKENKELYVQAAKDYISNNTTNCNRGVKKLYNVCNRSLQSLIRTRVVERDSSVPLEFRADRKTLRKVQRKNLRINPEMHAYVKLEMARKLRDIKKKQQQGR